MTTVMMILGLVVVAAMAAGVGAVLAARLLVRARNVAGTREKLDTGVAYDRGDEGDEPAEPASKVSLPIVQSKPQCGTCKHWDQAAGQREMAKNPAFARVMAFRQPYEQNWVRHPEYAAKEREISNANQELKALELERRRARLAGAEEGPLAGLDLSIKEMERKIETLEAELAKLPEWERGGLSDPGVRAMVGLTWEDFGVCTEKAIIIAKVDSCDQHTPRDAGT